MRKNGSDNKAKKRDSPFIFLVILCVFMGGSAFSQSSTSSSFQITPAPIPYPYFEAGRWDRNFNGMGASISAPGVSIGLAGFSGSFRYSLNDVLAWDFAGNMGVGSFNMSTLGIKGGMLLGGFSTNAEVQLGGKDGGLILFGGPAFEGFSLNNSATTLQYGQFGSIRSSLSGGQFGLQGNIKLGQDARLAPFVMVQSLAGSASVTGNFIGNGTNSTITSQIPAETSTSYGMDIIINDWSLGTFLQQLKQSSGSSSNVHTVVFQFGYSFSSADQYNKDKDLESQGQSQNPPAQNKDGKNGNEFQAPKM